MCQRDTWIEKRAGQSDRKGRVIKDGDECSTGESDRKMNEGSIIHVQPLKDNRSGQCLKAGRAYNNFDEAHIMDDKYTSVLKAIMGKAGRISKDGNQRMSWGGNCTKNEIPKINLNCSMTASKTKW